jgi:hypothetical protein
MQAFAGFKDLEASEGIRGPPSTTLTAGLFMPVDGKHAHPRDARLVDGDEQDSCPDGQGFAESHELLP